MTEEEKAAPKAPSTPQFIPKLRGKKVLIRLVTGGQPISGIVEAYNPYEIMVQTTKGPLLVFKHAIATIEVTEEFSWQQ
jgi:RNA chaperone Hfq